MVESVVERLKSICLRTEEGASSLDDRVTRAEEDLAHISADLEWEQGMTQALEARVGENVAILAKLQTMMEDIHVEVQILSMAMANLNNSDVDALAGRGFTSCKVPEPKAFGGAKGARELENFIFDLE